MLSERTVSVGGTDVFLREAGQGEPVVYLHGFPTSGYLWRDVLEQVSSTHRAIAPDFPGFGRSELMNGPHTWEALMKWVDDFVEELSLSPIHLAVHDWGGMIGIGWACQHPAKVRSLLLTDTSFRSKDRWHALAEQWRQRGTGEEFMEALDLEGFRNLLTVGGGLPDEAIVEYFKGLDSPERKAAKLEMYRSLEFSMLAPLEPRLTDVAPGKVRAIWGQNDQFVPPKVGERLAEKLGAQLTVLEAGHFLQEEKGPEVGRLHREWLGGLS